MIVNEKKKKLLEVSHIWEEDQYAGRQDRTAVYLGANVAVQLDSWWCSMASPRRGGVSQLRSCSGGVSGATERSPTNIYDLAADAPHNWSHARTLSGSTHSGHGHGGIPGPRHRVGRQLYGKSRRILRVITYSRVSRDTPTPRDSPEWRTGAHLLRCV